MKNIYILLAFIFFGAQLNAQSNSFLADSNWVEQESGTDDRLIEIYMKDASQGMIAGERTLLKTIDGGENWLLNDTLIQPYQRIIDVFTFDNTTFWMILEEDINQGDSTEKENAYKVLKSTDSTDTWDVLYTAEDVYLTAIHFTDSLNGWIAGSEMTIMHTSDGGYTWNEQLSDTSVLLFRDIYFIDENTGFVIGSNANLWKTTNGGQDWVQKGENLPWSSLQTIYFADQNHGWIGGSNGMIYYTADAGETWQTTQLGISDYIYDFYLRNNQLGWATSSSGRLFATTQGGLNWKISDTIARYSLQAIDFADEKHGWIVGENGIILHTNDADGGLYIPDHYTGEDLFSIYPNPATEHVYIRNISTQNMNALIFLMDITGKILLKDQISLSTQESFNVWNISSYPDGVYHVKIMFDDKTFVRKLLKY